MSSGFRRAVRALVTGASTGIGRATALRLAQEGYEIAVHYHEHAAEARALVAEIRSARGTAFAIGADLSQRGGAPALADAVTGRWDTLDVLVHNAGTYPRAMSTELSPESFETPFYLHVFSPAELTRRLRPQLERSQPGRVVFVSSILAYTGSTHGAHYAAAKAAQLGLAKSLALEYAPKIRVNVVAPGMIDTAILAPLPAEERARRERATPMGRIGRPEEVADAIAFLVSERSSYVTGTTLHVNGGSRMD